MSKNSYELRDKCSSTSSKKLIRCRSFYFRYMELCRAKNITPLPDIRSKDNANLILDIFGDKLSVNDWLLIVEALFYDQTLQILCIRMRKCWGPILEHLDSEKGAKLFRQKPSVYTKFVFSGIVGAVSNCIQYNKNLRVLHLEGLPLDDKYMQSIAKALSLNDSIKDISLQRSGIGDIGCEAICNTIKYLTNVEKLNLAECHLTAEAAKSVADMIKVQKISRYTEGWQNSLRYRDIDLEDIPGLRCISLARNPQIGDDGIKPIVEILKEDVWVKVIDMECCGLTDLAANLILDCLELNPHILDFNVPGNPDISKFLMRNIREHLGKLDGDQQLLLEGQLNMNGAAQSSNPPLKRGSVTVAQLKDQLKHLEEKLDLERILREKAEHLNAKLNGQVEAYRYRLEHSTVSNVPKGYVVVKNDSLQSIIKERNEYHKLASSAPVYNHVSHNRSMQTSPRSSYTNSYDRLSVSKSQLSLEHPSSLLSTPIYYDERIEPNSLSPSSASNEARKILKVRKVKSEMKYLEVPMKDVSKKKESKSDHEFANETDFQLTPVLFETNIGDTMDNAPFCSSGQITARTDKKPTEKFEMDDLSISSTQSGSSNSSGTGTGTLRNSVADFQPMRVYIRRNNRSVQRVSQYPKMQEINLGDGNGNRELRDVVINNRGVCFDVGVRDSGGGKPRTPRSLFWGLYDESAP